MTIELVRHSVAEEVAVYPRVKDKVSAEEAERAKQEHAEAEATLKRLEQMDSDDPQFASEIRTLMTEIREHVVIGHDVRIGAHALIKSHAVIGEEGFGMERDADGDNIRIPHLGSVVIEDHVEVGNFTTVCSGTIAPTRVGDHTKIDDHVHVAHNCRIGRNVIITACAEISGSVVIEDDAWIGPNASVIQGVTLGRNSLLGIGAVAVKSVPDDEIRIATPARRLGHNPRGAGAPGCGLRRSGRISSSRPEPSRTTRTGG